MDRNEALSKLRDLIGKDLVSLAKTHNVNIFVGNKKNKGWAGHVIERYLGLPLNSAQSPNFGSWELKVVPLKRLSDGRIVVKETMAITMIDPYHVQMTSFEQSHLLMKLKKMIVCARLFESQDEPSSIVLRVADFDLTKTDSELYTQIKRDYEEVRSCIAKLGFSQLTGRMGVLVQPRTKGPGHGSVSRAFYARKILVRKILNL